MQLTVRPATLEDLEEVLGLYYSFYRELREKQGCSTRSIDEYREEVGELLQRDHVLIAFMDDRAVGFARISEREGAYWIEELYVSPEHRCMGVGKRLVEKAEEYVGERSSAVYVMVLPQDRRAVEFWIHMGYEVLNTVELVKSLEPLGEGDTRPFEFFGYPIQIWKWRVEDYEGVEREYLEALEQFYEHGGTRELYLEITATALKKWVNERRKPTAQ